MREEVEGEERDEGDEEADRGRDERLGNPARHAARIHEALGTDEIEVDSFHHQALDRVSGDLTVVARAPDGVVEAVELDGDGYVLAVQWELQEEWRVDRRFLGPFAQFVAAASERR